MILCGLCLLFLRLFVCSLLSSLFSAGLADLSCSLCSGGSGCRDGGCRYLLRLGFLFIGILLIRASRGF